MFTTSRGQFPDIPGWQTTHNTIQAYTKVISAIRCSARKLENPWRQMSLLVNAEGFSATEIPFPNSSYEKYAIFVNLKKHKVTISTTTGTQREVSLQDGLSANDFAEKIFLVLNGAHISVKVDRALYEADTPLQYNPTHAELYLNTIHTFQTQMKYWQQKIRCHNSLLQLWPVSFNVSMECFGGKTIYYEENGSQMEEKSQVSIGFSLGDENYPNPYVFATPWPFDESIIRSPLPKEARWYSETWQGAILPYKALQEAIRPQDLLVTFLDAFYEAAKPHSMLP